MVESPERYLNAYWRDFPILRHALEGKIDPPRDFEMQRLFGIAAAALDLKAEVWKAANPHGKDGAHTDAGVEARACAMSEISRLAEELDRLGHRLESLSYDVNMLSSVIMRPDSP